MNFKDELNIDISIYKNEFKKWYQTLQKNNQLNGVLSNIVKDYSPQIYDIIPDEKIATLCKKSFYKGYLLVEYYINRNSYKNNLKIRIYKEAQKFKDPIIVLYLLILGNKYKTPCGVISEQIFDEILDTYFHKLVQNDKEIIEDIDEKEVIYMISYFMLLGILYRLVELKVEYNDFPDETHIDFFYFTNEKFPKIKDFLNRDYDKELENIIDELFDSEE